MFFSSELSSVDGSVLTWSCQNKGWTLFRFVFLYKIMIGDFRRTALQILIKFMLSTLKKIKEMKKQKANNLFYMLGAKNSEFNL